jgi:hypothetical protein
MGNGPVQEGLGSPFCTGNALSQTPHVFIPGGHEIRRWAFPFSLAVTQGILVSFFSSAY